MRTWGFSSLLWVISAGILLLVLALLLSFCSLLDRLRRLKRHAQAARRYRGSVARLRRVAVLDHLSALKDYWLRVREAAAPVVVTTPNGAIAAASKPFLELFGYASEQELKQVPVTALYVTPVERVQYVRATLEQEGRIRSLELRMKRRDGREIRILSSVRVVAMDDGVCYYEAVLTDITELRDAVEQRQQLEAQLHLARKLELVGQLASGIAHEINTPLQFIGDNAVFLKSAFERLTTPAAVGDRGRLLNDVSDAFRDSFEGIQRVSETVRAMKEFAHPGDLEIASTDLNQAIRTTLIVARNEYKHAADVKTVLNDIPPVDCRRAEINKVLLNLIVNAAHAIEGCRQARPRHDHDHEPRRGRAGLCRYRRYRHRHLRRRHAAHLRSLLHHQGGGQRLGPGPRHRPRHHEIPRRRAHGVEHRGRRRHLHPEAARRHRNQEH